jgi:alpha-tubulin suppressor-like RCC1 family protein
VGPFEVEGLPRVAFVDTGHSHTCALGEDAAVYCWGANDRGQVGDGQGEGFGHREADALSPVRILDGIAQLSVGNEFGCALDVGGGVWCWGWSTNGEVGYPTGADLFSPSPGRVSLPRADRVVDISAGHSNTCAVGESGRVFCWGGNGEGGPLGVGDPNPFVTDRPLEVLDIMTATSVSIGGSHACAIVGDGDLVCWGRNEFGAVGDGTTIDRPVPTAVVGLR